MVAMVPGGHPHREEAKNEHLTYDDRPTLLDGYHNDRSFYQERFRQALFSTDGAEIYPYHSPACDEPKSRFFESFFCEDYKGNKLRIWRQQYEIVGDTAKAISSGPIAERVRKLIDAGMDADSFRNQPPKDLVRYHMAKTLIQHRTQRPESQLGKFVTDPIKTKIEIKERKTNLNHVHQAVKGHFIDAVNHLWRKPESWDFLRAEYIQASDEEKRVMDSVVDITPLPKQTANERLDRDEIASADPAILASLPADVVFIVTDKNNTAMYFHWPQAIRILFGDRSDELLERLRADIKTYSYLEPPDEPDPHRHPLDWHWIEQNPWFHKGHRSQENSRRHHENVHGVYHFGFGGFTGRGKTDIQIKRDSCKKSTDTRRVLTEMEGGSLACIAEAHRFVEEIIDPVLVKRQVAAMKKFPHCATVRIPDEAYNVCAVLNCVKTESHQDSSDVARGLAMISPVGEFQGGDFCIKDLGIKHPFKAGAISAIRGHEIPHCTDNWVGRERYCFVNAFHEMVMQRAEEMLPGQVLAKDGKTTKMKDDAAGQDAYAVAGDRLKGSKDDVVCDLTPFLGESECSTGVTPPSVRLQQDGQAIEEPELDQPAPSKQGGWDVQHPICLSSDDELEPDSDILGKTQHIEDLITKDSEQGARPAKRRKLE